MTATPCPKCGFSVPAGADSCPKCGVVLAKVSTPQSRVRATDVIVTTGDLRENYEILGPVFSHVTNKSGQLDELARKFGIEEKEKGPDLISTVAYAFLLGELPLGQQHFRRAFAVCIADLRAQVSRLGGDALVWLRQDLDLDTTGFQYFYMQAYGTAVRRTRS